jgi:dienelactone hydrolase
MSKVNLRGSVGVWLLRLLLLAALALAFLPHLRAGQGADAIYGSYGPEGPRLREQLWILPGADARVPLRATVFRPAEDAPARSVATVLDGAASLRRPLVGITHGSDETTREAASMPVFYWLSRWFVERGYVVVLPQRRGHGATGGEMAEGRDTCADPDHRAAGLAAADDIEAVLRHMGRQPFVDASRLIVAGISTGGWASLALASRNLPGVRLVVNFAGGRGGHAYGRPGAVCAPDQLIATAGSWGQAARVATLWLYAENDSYFGPELAAAMAGAWTGNGGRAHLHLLAAYGAEGHNLVGDRAGWSLWGRELDRSLAQITPPTPQRTSQAR